MMKKTILFYLLVILFFASCSDDNNNELKKDIEQITIEKVLGNTYYCNEQNSTIEFISYNSLENSNWGKDAVYFVNCKIYGDILKETGQDVIELSLKVDNNVISDRSQGIYQHNISFTIVDRDLLIGSLKAKGNWVRI